MPRLTDNTILKQRSHLRYLWFNHDRGEMSSLSATEQWDLHSFLAPSESFGDQHTLTHGIEVSKEQPSLPQRAGRAYAHRQTIEDELARQHRRAAHAKGERRINHRAKDRNVVVRDLVSPTIDYEKLTVALLEQARLDEAKSGRQLS